MSEKLVLSTKHLTFIILIINTAVIPIKTRRSLGTESYKEANKIYFRYLIASFHSLRLHYFFIARSEGILFIVSLKNLPDVVCNGLVELIPNEQSQNVALINISIKLSYSLMPVGDPGVGLPAPQAKTQTRHTIVFPSHISSYISVV